MRREAETVTHKKKGKQTQELDHSKVFSGLHCTRLRIFLSVAFCCLLVFSISYLVWNGSAPLSKTEADPGTQLVSDVPKAVVLDGLYTTSPDAVFSQSMKSYLSTAGFKVDVFQGENVTIDLLRNVGGYKVLVLRLHSAVHSDGFLYLFSGQKYSQSMYSSEQLQGAVRRGVTFEGDEFFAINAVFLGGNKPAGLNGSTIILMGCNGTSDELSVHLLFDKGVKTYIGWNGYVDLSHSDKATLSLVKNLYVEKRTVKTAIDEVMRDVGPDPSYGTALEYQTR